MKKYMMVFTITTVIISFTDILSRYLLLGYIDIISGMITGLLLGCLFTLFFGISQYYTIKELPYKEKSDANKTYQIRKINLNVQYEHAFQLCLNSVEMFGDYKIVSNERNTGIVVVKVGMTIKSWGETLSFTIKKIDDNSTDVEISSKPTVPTTLFDYGKNFDNVERVKTYLMNASSITQ